MFPSDSSCPTGLSLPPFFSFIFFPSTPSVIPSLLFLPSFQVVVQNLEIYSLRVRMVLLIQIILPLFVCLVWIEPLRFPAIMFSKITPFYPTVQMIVLSQVRCWLFCTCFFLLLFFFLVRLSLSFTLRVSPTPNVYIYIYICIR
ncbi:hypothetical protein, unlikely [Trypanosoma brucei gambiense DAL972]|uniref:Uncharacterized protein n=1 Tax=Trypanosoma brucei gambiense (strain MHOM/CI/86/DAL972) TaxID=679716 RepID=D0A405_TRYB9|nr:hypothetical protein, unlikely [Trypanosoma brucei gambiense DAL972]CBH15999.1 hypothetical protein, unlikely [Trypanosoma brucei gambiense DAL972]|eukprot:XP_011778263.1 hypothetical protein, unlikely [Trypanosoma brucei gambiense DAL972]